MANDNWRTPKKVFDTLNREFNFIADMASSNQNALCDVHFTENDDSLSFDWFDRLEPSNHDYVWCNPPYSDPMPWIKKAAEAQSAGLGVVMLLNSDCSVGWFAEALCYVSEIRNIIATPKQDKDGGHSNKYNSGRIGFINDNGVAVNGNSKPQCILVFNPFKFGECATTYITKSELYDY